MPIDEATTLTIACDNPDCPGNALDPSDRVGWLFVTHEVYGESTTQHVFCSYGCLGAAGIAVESDPTVGPFGKAAEPAV
jgi:hypothetical protein